MTYAKCLYFGAKLAGIMPMTGKWKPDIVILIKKQLPVPNSKKLCYNKINSTDNLLDVRFKDCKKIFWRVWNSLMKKCVLFHQTRLWICVFLLQPIHCEGIVLLCRADA